jgi:hypothetical protein
MTIPVLLDLLVAVLLALTIGYAAVLNRRLRRLREGEAELRQLFSSFNESAARAEDSLKQIKGLVKLSDRAFRVDPELARLELEPLVAHARRLAADLDMLVQRGESAANRIEGAPRTETPARLAPPANESPRRSRAERELAEALKGVR